MVSLNDVKFNDHLNSIGFTTDDVDYSYMRHHLTSNLIVEKVYIYVNLNLVKYLTKIIKPFLLISDSNIEFIYRDNHVAINFSKLISYDEIK